MEFQNRSFRRWMEEFHGMTELQDTHENPWVEEFPEVWARYNMDCGLVAEEVEVTGGPVPFQEERQFPKHLDGVVASLVQEMLEEGIVVRGRSPSNSPLSLMPKGDGSTWRLTIDCKEINRVTDRQPTESLDRTKVVAMLSPRSRYFSTLDLSCCSFAIPLTAASSLRFAFTFHGRQYLFTRLPPRFRHTVSIVHRRVVRMLDQLPPEDRGWVLSFTDDIIITGKTREETASRTRNVLRLIQATGFKVKLEKAQLVQPEVDYLGMKLSARGRELQASKREYIANAPPPLDSSSLRSLLGNLGSHQDHVEGYAELAWPLQQLLNPHQEWQWGREQQWALRRLIQAVLAAPALRFVDRSQPFVIRPTAGKEVTGAALLQEDEKGRMVPVWFKSHVLKGHQVFFSPEEKDCVAVLRAVHAFQDLIGPAPIVIQMPRSSWKYLLWGDTETFCWPTPCKKQWNLLLVNGGENIPRAPHPSGAPVRAAPPLKHLLPYVPHSDVWFTAGSWACVATLGFAATNLEERWLLGLMQHGSPAGVELEAIRVLLQEHRSSKPLYVYANAHCVVQGLQDGDSKDRKVGGERLWESILQWVHANPGVLHVGHSKDGEELQWNQKVLERARSIQAWVLNARGQRVWEPSKHEKQEIVALSHSGHVGKGKTLSRVWKVARWEGDREQVAQWVQRCSCFRSPPLPQRMEGPWSRLQLTRVKGLPPSSEKYSSLLVLLDEFSGWVDAFPMREGNTKEVAELLKGHVVQRLGMPCCVTVGQSERSLQDAVRKGLEMGVDVQYPSPNWVADIATSLQRLGVDVQYPSPSWVANIATSLQRLAQSAGKHWADSILLIVAALRATCVRSAVLSSYQLCFHHPLVLKVSPCEEEAAPGPTEPLLPWLARLRDDRAEYKKKVEEAVESDECDAE
ncbi:uncharacterized protein LOC110396570 [Numida meleagris]|uniref:uncharacterized protein LOC110396570 n=1 Tax=Numida meleagris TaxID=8996 RepID=UPI000B3DB61E|nr:uncharacterized protein LOC110396570 [Numida meleagris]